MTPPCPGVRRATGAPAAVKRGGAKEKCSKQRLRRRENKDVRVGGDEAKDETGSAGRGVEVGGEDGVSSVGLRVRRQPLMTTTYPAAPPPPLVKPGFCR